MRAIEEALELAIVATSSPSSKEQYNAAYEACVRALVLLRSLAPPPAKELSEEALKQEADASVDMYTDLSQGDKEFRKRSLHLQQFVMDLRDNGHLSPAPPPSGAVVRETIPVHQAVRIVRQWIIDRDLAMNQGRDTFGMLTARMEGYLRSMREEEADTRASSPSEPTVDKQVDKIMEVVMTWYKNPKRGGLGFTMQDGIDLLRNEIKALLSR